MSVSFRARVLATLATLLWPVSAPAQASNSDVAQASAAAPTDVEDEQPPNVAPKPVPPRAPERQLSLQPRPVEPPPQGHATFAVDPVADIGIISVSLGFAVVLDQIISTGEIRPQQIAIDFNHS